MTDNLKDFRRIDGLGLLSLQGIVFGAGLIASSLSANICSMVGLIGAVINGALMGAAAE